MGRASMKWGYWSVFRRPLDYYHLWQQWDNSAQDPIYVLHVPENCVGCFERCSVIVSPIHGQHSDMTKFSLPKIVHPAIVYAECVVIIGPFFVGVYP